TTFSWTNNNASIGLAASGVGNIGAFAATNAGTTPVTATITVTPFYGACAGATDVFTITVIPTPSVTDPSDVTYCNGVATTVVTFTGVATAYNWTNSDISIGLAASGTGNVPSFTATNATALPVTATITVTPRYTVGAVNCDGTPQTFDITVQPTPSVVATADQNVCNGANTTAVTFTGTATS